MSRSFLLRRWIPASLLLLALCLFFAARLYPRYSIFHHDISFLGHPQLNPGGWWFWSLGMGVCGVMLWPVAVYLSRQMTQIATARTLRQRKLAVFGSTSLRFACFGLIGLALIPQYPTLIIAHQIAGAVAFTGLYVATVIFWWSFSVTTTRGLTKIFFLALATWGPLGFLSTQGFRFFAYGEVGHSIKVKHESLALCFSLWEWMLMICVMSSTILLVVFLPVTHEKPAAPLPASHH